ncbi:oligosaccharide flippase family protein [Crenobacter caeni]|uniref:Oligosaccharide flippase family protein n=1 Tax=Crenobacter caeni TaxID=2705474 RepID=A0A6B2KSS2_9NEIS|nr:oligosaccharide flippase family protein [Crenobacter caeni]NDV13295.1 oligosaccharide flippase family protein [Crenobacter caeni]
MTKHHIVNIAWALIDKLVQLTLSMITVGWIAKYFGVSSFGSYQYALSVLIVATSLTWLFPGEIFYRLLNSKGDVNKRYITSSIILRAAISFTVYITLLIYTYLQSNNSESFSFIFILLITILYSEPLGIFRFLSDTTGNTHKASLFRISASLAKTAFIYTAIKLELNHNAIVLASLVEPAITSTACVYIYKKLNTLYRFNLTDYKKTIATKLLIDGIKFWPGLIFMYAFMRMDRLMLKDKIQSEIYGHYTAAMSIFDLIPTLATLFIAILAPSMVYNNKNSALKNITKLTLVLLIASLVIVLLSQLISTKLINLIFGLSFNQASEILNIAILITPIIFVDFSLSTFIIKNGKGIAYSLKWTASALVCFLTIKLNTGWESGIYGQAIGWATSASISILYIIHTREKK